MRKSPVLLAAVVLVSVIAGAAPVAAQETVTLTVTVENQQGQPVGGATINATWDGGQTTARTASNGKAFVDVPKGADVRLDARSDNYIRNIPKLVKDATARDVTLEVAKKGSLSVATFSGGAPLTNVEVTLKKGGNTVLEAKTNSEGKLKSGVIEQGTYQVSVYKSGYYRNATTVEVNKSTSVTFGMVQGTTNVQFQVVDGHFRPPKPLSDAQVTVEGIGTQRTTSGTVTFTVPVNSWYSVTATKEGYVTNQTRLYVGTDVKKRTLSIERKKKLLVEPANERIVVGEKVTVTVRNAYEEPVSGAAVFLDGEKVATTGENGQARFAIESAGEHEITAKASGVTSAAVVVKGVAVATDTKTPTESPTATPTPKGPLPIPQPGFGPAVAVIALAATAFLLRRR